MFVTAILLMLITRGVNCPARPQAGMDVASALSAGILDSFHTCALISGDYAISYHFYIIRKTPQFKKHYMETSQYKVESTRWACSPEWETA